MARRALREIGLRARFRLRSADRSLGVLFGDGSVARIGSEDLRIEGLGTSSIASMKKFAQAFSRFRGWRDNTNGQAWPFPRPERAGMPLAGTAYSLSRHTAERLRRAKFIFLHDLEDRNQRALTILHQIYMFEVDPLVPPEHTVLLLTSECQAEVAADPAWYRDRLQSFSARYPDASVLCLDDDGDRNGGQSLARFLSVMDELALQAPAGDDQPNPLS